MALRNQGAFDQAVVDLTSVLQLAPDDEVALNARGFCYRKLRNFEAAAADYGRLIELGHRAVRCYNARAYCYASMGRYAAAVQVGGGRMLTWVETQQVLLVIFGGGGR